jgi:succinyl-CoA:(S)-malate CoA-transferase subunit B
MGRPELADEASWGTVAAWTVTMDRAHLMHVCEEVQVPCGPVYAIDEIFGDPHYEARGNILRMHDPRAGDLAVPNVVPRLGDTPGRVEWLGPALGAHNAEIYQQRLGLTGADLERLRESGVI